MLRIGEFSKLSRISIRMLRHYDEIGLLEPAATDQATGYRIYREEQLFTAGRINALRGMGFSLAVIGEILTQYNDPILLRGYLRLKRAELHEQAESLSRCLTLLETTLNRLEQEESAMQYNVTLKEIPVRYVASVRSVIPTYEHEGTLWHTLMKETAPLGMADGEPCYTVAIFHDREFKERDVDVEVQKSVKGSYANTEHVVFKTEPAVQVASATFKGSYDQFDTVNAAVANWVRDNGYTFDGQPFDIYHVSPHETQNPEEFVTELCYPVRK